MATCRRPQITVYDGNQTRKERKRSEFELTVRWVVGHEGVEGNELADYEAKEAARGANSDKKFVPPYFRRKILTTGNPSALKQTLTISLRTSWKTAWRSSERAMGKIDASTPSAKFSDSVSHPEILRSCD
ncbi:hypothetical protein BC826DRAFT_911526 [Russula brevipes]|nr:hypothetical protein BC826DRAFT_911526 [Russula brevipes]